METSVVKISGLRHLSQPGRAGGHFQRAKAWMWDVCIPATKKLLPVAKQTYQNNKTWCERLAGAAVFAGLYTGMISLPTFFYLGGGFAAGFYCSGSINEEGSRDSTVTGPSPGLPANDLCSKQDIVALMKIIDDLLLQFLDMNAKVDALTADRTMTAVNRLRREITGNKEAIAQDLPDDIGLKEALQIACVIRPRIFLTLLHEISGVNSAREDVGQIVSEIVGESFHNPCPEIRRKRRADYEQLADAFLGFGTGNSQGGRLLSEKVQVDILHGITAPWIIADEDRAHEVMHKIDKAASLAFHRWKKARTDG